ncbi:uncharacterized protein LOC131183130 [Hevea brasiliensis]|uniref:uncharacterized protein LOC131183130 n=1 Tax=Hevea brasiliensis TaxID=3981 RepID=UPI0025E02EC8|nr:uncharacterized protein LOC131183130 [Hevea brasiliensis]
MRNFIQSVDIDAWRIIKNGPHVPQKNGTGTTKVPKHEDEYDDNDWKKISINAKAINILHCSLDLNEYNRVSGCQSAKQIWDKLEVTYEGTDVVKESRANLLIRDYELFDMRPGESIADMSTRFTDLVNLLKALGKKFEEAELVKKILRSLPKSWEAKTTVIQDTKDFKTFTYDELIGSLIAHEMVYKKDEVEYEQKKKKSIALKSNKDEDKKKGVAFKADSSDNSSVSSDDEDEMAVLARKFKRAFKKGGSKYKKFLKKHTPKDKYFKDSKEEIVCYECHKLTYQAQMSIAQKEERKRR